MKEHVEQLATLVSILCLFAGTVLLACTSATWQIMAGTVLVCVAWGLARHLGAIAGRRQGRLEEGKRRDQQPSGPS